MTDQNGTTDLTGRRFARLVIVPNLQALVALIALGTITDQTLAELAVRLSGVVFLAGAALFVIREKRIDTDRETVRLLVSFVAVIVFLAVHLRLTPFLNFLLPGTVALLLSLRLTLGTTSAVLLAQSISALTSLGWVVLFLLGQTSWVDGVWGLGLVLLTASVVVTKAFFFHPLELEDDKPHHPPRGDAVGLPIFDGVVGPNGEAEVELNRFLRRAAQLLLGETVQEMGWRLAAFALLSDLLMVASLSVSDFPPTSVSAVISIVVLQLLFLYRVLSRTSLQELFSVARGLVMLTVSWWLVEVLFHLNPSLLNESTLVAAILMLGMMPWPHRELLPLGLMFALVIAARMLVQNSPPVFALLQSIATLFMLRGALLSHLELASRTGLAVLNLYGEACRSVYTVLRLSAWAIGELLPAVRVILLFGSGRAEIVEREVRETAVFPSLHRRALLDELVQQSEPVGLLRSRTLEPDLREAVWAAMEARAEHLIFARVQFLERQGERVVFLLAPFPRSAALLGSQRLLLAVRGVISFARTTGRLLELSTAREGAAAAAPGGEISEDPRRLSSVVHLLNNVTQELSSRCDDLAESVDLSLKERSAVDGEELQTIKSSIRALEREVRAMAAHVSDMRVLEELAASRSVRDVPGAALTAVFQDLEETTVPLLYSRGSMFQLEGGVKDDTLLIGGLSGDEARAVLRGVLLGSGAFTRHRQRIRLKVDVEENFVHCQVLLSPLVADAARTSRPESVAAEHYSILWTDLEQVLQRRQGVVERPVLVSSGVVRSGLSLPRFRGQAVKELKPLMTPRGWALLVDDREEIVRFYSRVADALTLESVVATTLSEALEALERLAAPQLVLTDIQLGDEDGLTVVRRVRERFGDAIPVITVSGDEGMAQRAVESGATMFLLKPVGRGRLFREIQRVLTKAGSK